MDKSSHGAQPPTDGRPHCFARTPCPTDYYLECHGFASIVLLSMWRIVIRARGCTSAADTRPPALPHCESVAKMSERRKEECHWTTRAFDPARPLFLMKARSIPTQLPTQWRQAAAAAKCGDMRTQRVTATCAGDNHGYTKISNFACAAQTESPPTRRGPRVHSSRMAHFTALA